MMNELQADVSGVVRDILVENGATVEYGQALFPSSPSEAGRDTVSPAPSRKQARRDAVFLLYQSEVTDLSMEELRAWPAAARGLRAGRVHRAGRERRAGLDGRAIDDAHHEPRHELAAGAHRAARAQHPAPGRCGRCAAATTPPEVAIDEAVRLAKRYATDEAGSFVNGVLRRRAARSLGREAMAEPGGGRPRPAPRTTADAGPRARRHPARSSRSRAALVASSSGEVEISLLERATELVEEAGRLLEQLGGLAG